MHAESRVIDYLNNIVNLSQLFKQVAYSKQSNLISNNITTIQISTKISLHFSQIDLGE